MPRTPELTRTLADTIAVGRSYSMTYEEISRWGMEIVEEAVSDLSPR